MRDKGKNKNITIKEFKEYLNGFDDNDNFSIIIVNSKKRIVHKNADSYLFEDSPTIIIETTEQEPLDGVKGE